MMCPHNKNYIWGTVLNLFGRSIDIKELLPDSSNITQWSVNGAIDESYQLHQTGIKMVNFDSRRVLTEFMNVSFIL